MIFETADLLSKFGFGDGDMLYDSVRERPTHELMAEAWEHREIVRLACQYYGAGR